MKSTIKFMAVTLCTLLAVSCLTIKEVKGAPMEETFEYSGIKELKVDGLFFKVDITGYSGSIVEGKIAIPQTLFKDKFVEVVHSKNGSVLEVQVLHKKIAIPRFTDEAIIQIRVPMDTRVDLKTSSGKIEAEQIQTDEIRLESTSGKIQAEDLSATNVITKSTSGAIVINNCKGAMGIKSTSGRISLREGTGNISANSTSGGQMYEGIMGNIDAQSTSGKIIIHDQTGTLTLEATSGALEGDDVHLKGDSSFTTSSGRISFDFVNDIDEFSFDLSSKSGMLNVGQSKARGRLVFGSGGIKITGKSTSGAQTYR
ncbi:MAG: DUF4097 family beta strand repeat protein [Spirochaetota bacterium]|nr:MAG: DUF4097 family beta strand repeat protein [Spirochaetota bacterium]